MVPWYPNPHHPVVFSWPLRAQLSVQSVNSAWKANQPRGRSMRGSVPGRKNALKKSCLRVPYDVHRPHHLPAITQQLHNVETTETGASQKLPPMHLPWSIFEVNSILLFILCRQIKKGDEKIRQFNNSFYLLYKWFEFLFLVILVKKEARIKSNRC